MQPRDFQLLTLCGFMHNKNSFSKLGSELGEDNFTEPDLREVFMAMIQGGPAFTLPEVASQAEAVGGMALVRDISRSYRRYGVDKEFTEHDVRKYATAVEKTGRLSHLREVVKAAHRNLGGKNLLTVKDEKIVSELLSELSEIQYGKRTRSGFRRYDVFLKEFYGKFDDVMKGKKSIDRQPTGFKSFDRETGGGLPCPGLVVVAGQPGSGKTQLAWQWVLNGASKTKKIGEDGIYAVNSAEMSGLSLASRAVLSAAGIDSSVFRVGGYNEDEEAIASIKREFRKQIGLPIFIDDSEFLTSNIINARISGLRAKYHNKRVVMVITDFAEIIADKAESVEQRVASVFINAKALSKLLRCTVVLLSQLSRAVEASGTRVPGMRHLRYSGMAEAVADMIVLIYNPTQYIESGIKITEHPDMPARSDTAYLILGKHKDGPIGYIPMGWVSTFTKWSDLGPKTKLIARVSD